MQPKRISVWGDLLVVTMIFLVATLVSTFLLVVLSSVPYRLLVVIVYSAQFVLAIGGAGAYYRWREGRGPGVFSISFKWFAAPVALLGVVLTAAASVVLEPLLNLFPEHYFDRIGETIGSGAWSILLSVLLAPVLEELFFRGLVLEHTLRKWPAWKAVGVSALMFGLVHLPNLPQMVNAAVMGIVIGYIYVMTRSLVSVIVVHATNNAIAYMFLETTGTQHTDLRQLLGNDAFYWAIFAASMLILAVPVVMMALRAEKYNKTKKISLQDNE